MSMQDGWARIEAGQAGATGAGGAKALLAAGYAVLDIRPAREFANGRVAGAVHVPLFVADDGRDPVTLVKKAVSDAWPLGRAASGCRGLTRDGAKGWTL